MGKYWECVNNLRYVGFPLRSLVMYGGCSVTHQQHGHVGSPHVRARRSPCNCGAPSPLLHPHPTPMVLPRVAGRVYSPRAASALLLPWLGVQGQTGVVMGVWVLQCRGVVAATTACIVHLVMTHIIEYLFIHTPHHIHTHTLSLSLSSKIAIANEAIALTGLLKAWVSISKTAHHAKVFAALADWRGQRCVARRLWR